MTYKEEIAWLDRELAEVKKTYAKAVVMCDYLAPLHAEKPWAGVRHPDEPGRSFEDWRLIKGNCAAAIEDYERRLFIARENVADGYP